MSQEVVDKSTGEIMAAAAPPSVEELRRMEAIVEKIEKMKAQGWDPAQLGDPKVFAKIGRDGRLIAIRADITLEERLGHLYSIQGKTSITASGYARINSVTALNVITPEAPKLLTDEKTGRLKAVEVRKMCIGFSPSGSLLVTDSTLHFDLDAYRLHELANLMKKKPGAVEFILAEDAAQRKIDGKKGWVVPYDDPVMLWVDLQHEDVRDALIADSQRRKFAERIASTICWRNAIKTHPAIAQAQVSTSGNERGKIATVRVYGFRHDLDQAGMTRLAAGIVDGKLDVVKEQLRTIPGATQEITVEKHTAIAGPDDVIAEAGAVVDEEESAVVGSGDELPLAMPKEPHEERERLLDAIQIGAEALNSQTTLTRLMAEAGVSDPRAASIEQLEQLNRAISKEVDTHASDTTDRKRTQSPKS